MRSFILTFILLSLSLVASSDPILSRWVPHERRSHTPSGWKLVRKHDASAVIPLRFALSQSNLERIDQFLYDVSHPDSPNYGKHWSPGQVASAFAPSRHTIDTVQNWLLESGIESHRIKLSSSRGWLEFKATVREAENLLHTSYNVYGHVTGTEHVACESYYLPERLRSHVDFVTPTVHFDAKLSKRFSGRPSLKSIGSPRSGNVPATTGAQVNLNNLGNCDTHITPACLRALYGFYYEPVAAEKNSFGLVEFTPQSYRQQDLNLFFKNFSSDLVGVSPVMSSIDGGVLISNQTFKVNAESDLDLQYAMSLVTSKQNVTLFQVGDVIEGGSFGNFLDALDGSYCTYEGGDDPTQDSVYPDKKPGGYRGSEDCGTVKPTYVIATSYGGNEVEATIAYSSRQCNEYAKLGLLGITFLYSSGDYGVAGNGASGGLCLNPNGTETVQGKIFNPAFPSTCPYVTSVGATQLSPGKTVLDSEDACQEAIRSGGGWSNYFALPDYQKSAVSSYLRNTPPNYPGSIWNSTGKSRAYPDLSVNGANYVIAVDNNFTLIYGTSAAVPTFGAMLTMVNDARIARNKSTIGFINPVIYSANFSDAFNDITNGTNPGCGTRGFNTSKGWDPVTGLGTPNFPKLLDKWLQLP